MSSYRRPCSAPMCAVGSTTFSTMQVEIVENARRAAVRPGVVYAVVSVLTGIAAVQIATAVTRRVRDRLSTSLSGRGGAARRCRCPSCAFLSIGSFGRLGRLVRPVRDARGQRVRGRRSRGDLRACPGALPKHCCSGTATIGAYTTSSTSMFETQRLAEDRRSSPCGSNIVVSLLVGLRRGSGRALAGGFLVNVDCLNSPAYFGERGRAEGRFLPTDPRPCGDGDRHECPDAGDRGLRVQTPPAPTAARHCRGSSAGGGGRGRSDNGSSRSSTI